MNFLEFRNKWFEFGCINTNQVYTWKNDFDKNNLTRWTQKGLLIKLKNNYYTFPEYRTKSDFAFYIANRIYRPSYISLHTALAFYGMIPESVVQFTSVSSLKTASFINVFGHFSYKSVRPDLMFGYDIKPMPEGRFFILAKPEKALLDLLYLYPFYNTRSEIKELRLDSDFLETEINMDIIKKYTRKFNCKAFEKRVQKVFD